MNCNEICNYILQYDTVKYVTVKNKKIGLLFRLLQIAILGYIIGYVVIYKKGYQDFSDIESAVTTKVKGVLYTNFSDAEFVSNVTNKKIYQRVWDVPDYVVPASENGAFFVATNVIITENQTQSVCAEDSDVSGSFCNGTNQCAPGEILTLGNGPMTGNCCLAKQTCQIQGWCPLEIDVGPLKNEALLLATGNFTVLIKNFISFPKHGVTRRNVLDTSNETYLSNCKYAPDGLDKQCPVFILEDIVKNSGEDYAQMALKGGVVAIIIDWNCNLDLSVKKCIPTYSFKRLDEPHAKIAKGWNFRYANYYKDGVRTLYKMYGIDFVILVRGTGGKFSFIPLLLNIGSGVGLLAAASVISDIAVLYCVKKRLLYASKKYREVETEYDGFKEYVVPPDEPTTSSSPNDLSYRKQIDEE